MSNSVVVMRSGQPVNGDLPRSSSYHQGVFVGMFIQSRSDKQLTPYDIIDATITTLRKT
jgi:hypothetical protein